MKRIKKSLYISALLGLGIAVLANTASAAEITGVAKVGIGQSDNLQRTLEDPIDVGIAFTGVEFGYVELSRKLVANILVNADYLVYDDSRFDSELVGGIVSFLDYYFIEERFWWGLEYNFGQQVFDPLTPIRPGNREDVSFLTTGPAISLPFGDRNALDVELNYSTINYEIRPNDNHRINGELGVSRDIGEGRTIALIGVEEQVTYDDEVANPDFDRRELFFRWSTLSARNIITFDVGYSELVLENPDPTPTGDDEVTGDGEVLRLDWTRIVSTSTSFTLGGGSRYSDQGDIFRFAQITNFDDRETEDVLGLATPFRNNFFNVSYNLDRERFSLDLLANWNEEDYEGDDTFDRSVTRFTLLLSRQLTRKVTGNVNLSYSIRDFDALDRKDNDILGMLSLNYEFNPAFTASVSYQRTSRGSTDPNDEFDENRVFLTFSYIPRWSR